MKILLSSALTGLLLTSSVCQAVPIPPLVSPSNIISNVSNHPYSTVVSPISSLAVVSGFQGIKESGSKQEPAL